ncbi:hypothetical protein [Aliikangiella sp. IMCC44359]|uniref:hypothetical protein n=1 Tax=Aliikangiella sp. IMCC44359 TaxID=3459125 RepID=UPI00403B2DC9
MLNNEINHQNTQHGKLANYSEVKQTVDFKESDLELAIKKMEEESNKYEAAGLTNVSSWLE